MALVASATFANEIVYTGLFLLDAVRMSTHTQNTPSLANCYNEKSVYFKQKK